jgi:Fe-S-cluster containining protein
MRECQQKVKYLEVDHNIHIKTFLTKPTTGRACRILKIRPAACTELITVRLK